MYCASLYFPLFCLSQGRVYRDGQTKDVNIWRIQVLGPEGEDEADETIDVSITRRNEDEKTIEKATNT